MIESVSTGRWSPASQIPDLVERRPDLRWIQRWLDAGGIELLLHLPEMLSPLLRQHEQRDIFASNRSTSSAVTMTLLVGAPVHWIDHGRGLEVPTDDRACGATPWLVLQDARRVRSR